MMINGGTDQVPLSISSPPSAAPPADYAASIRFAKLFLTELTAFDTGWKAKSVWIWVLMIAFRSSGEVSDCIQSLNASGFRMTGILWWMSLIDSLASAVRMVQDRIGSSAFPIVLRTQ